MAAYRPNVFQRGVSHPGASECKIPATEEMELIWLQFNRGVSHPGTTTYLDTQRPQLFQNLLD